MIPLPHAAMTNQDYFNSLIRHKTVRIIVNEMIRNLTFDVPENVFDATLWYYGLRHAYQCVLPVGTPVPPPQPSGL